MSYGSFPIHLIQESFRHDDRPDRIDSPVIGLVVDNVDPAKLARVRLSFPSLPGDDASAWAPITSLGAGDDRGWFFLPEVGDEVLVMFEHGDIGRPVVIGGLWNGEDEPPDRNDGGNERRSIVSREGSRILFDDDKGVVRLEDGKGIGAIEIDAEGKISLEATKGDVCLQAPGGALHIVANAVEIKASAACHIESLDGIAFGADRTLSVRGMPLQVHGQKVELNPGGVSSPAAPTADCEDVPDPLE
jgi:uncharacterized protein involved in type VI secretion and phage assembly